MREAGRRASAFGWRRLLVGVIALLSTGACARMGDLTGPTPIGGSVVSVVLSNTAITMSVGATVTLQAAGRDRDNQPITDRPVVWSSSDSTVVSVSPSGVLTALSTGSAQIAASIAGRSAVAQVSVTARPVASVEIGPLAPRVSVGGFVQLVAIPRDETGTALPDRVVFWSSSDAAIANVDATGFVSGLSAGAATITARSENREAAVGVLVAEVPVASVVVTPRVDTIVVGQTTQLVATPRDSLTVPLVGRAITWLSANSAIATVSASGLVLGITPGTVNIAAESDNVSGTATIVVQPRPIGAVIVSPAQATLTIGESTPLTVQVTDQSGNLLTGRAISFSSENPAIAQVSAEGVVRAIGVGSTIIRVTSEGQSGQMSVTVTPTPVASVRITPSSASLRIGSTASLTASALDAGGNVLAQRVVSWSSGAPSVFSVDSTGVVRALSAGAGLVFAVIDGRLASASITVTQAAVAVVEVAPPTLNLVIGGTSNLTATARDAAGAVLSRPVVWSSSNPLAVVVSSSGTVRALTLGSARIDATVDGVVGSAALTVTPVPVASVRVTLTDSTLNVGQTTQAVAELRTASDSILTGRTVLWTSSVPDVASVSSAGVVTAVSGGSANIVGTSDGVSGSATVTVTQVAGSLAIQTQPAGAVSGNAFTTQPVVRILDARGDLVTTGPGATVAVTASKASGAATLSGTLTVNAVGGIATFTNLAFTGVGTGAHTVRFTTASPELTVTSVPINVVVGAAANIVPVSTQSQSAPVLSLVSAPPSVRVTDAGGNPVSGRAVTFTVTAGLGITTPSSGSSVSTNASGVASLAQWRLGPLPGLNRVLATSAGLTGSPVTFNATATIGAPTQLGVSAQPAGAVSGRVLTTQPEVEVRDAAGNRVTGATSAVTARISSGTGTLVGTLTVNAVNGVATFTDLRIDGSGAHQLEFSAAGLSSATSNSLTVTQVASALLVQTQPAGARSGEPFTTQPVVRIVDDAGLLVTTGAGATLAVNAAVASGVGTLGGTATVNASGGIATFTNLSLSGLGPHTLRFSTAAPALNIVSASVIVEPGPPDAMEAVSPLTQSAQVLSAVSAPPSVRVVDAAGNAVAGVAVVFAVTSGGGVTVPASGSTVTTNASGLATLGSWTLGATLGENSVTAAVSGLKGSPITFTATATVGPPAQLTIATQPSGAVSGVALTTQPVVQIRDAGGNLVTTATNSVTVAVASGDGAVGGTVTVTAVGGTATFTNLLVNGSGAQTLRFSATGLTSVVSESFTVTQVAAALVVQTQPGTASSGVAFGTQPVIHILDNAGLLVTTGAAASLPVSASIETGTGTLGGTAVVNAVNGVATFTNLSITGSGTHTLQFTTADPSLAVSSTPFVLGAGAPTTIVPDSDVSQSAAVGTAVAEPPSVRVTDGAGNAVAGVEVTFSVTLGGGTSVPSSGSTVTTNGSGIASLTSWTLGASVGANAVTAVASGLVGSPVTFSATGTAGGASKLAIIAQPTGAVSGVAFATQPEIEIQDASGNRVVSASNAVTAALISGTGSLMGTTTVNAVNGVATFTNLRVNGSGVHAIEFSAGGLGDVTSESFAVTQVAASLELQTQPAGAVTGEAFTTQPIVRILDNAGLVVTTGAAATLAVTATIESGTGALGGTQTVNAVNGIATFTDLSITGSGAHTLEFSTAAPDLAVVSASFDVTAGAPVATQLAVTTQPDGAVSGVALTVQPVVEVRDVDGALVNTATNAVTATIASGTGALFGTQTVNAVNGVATFTNLRVEGAGAHTLTFTATGLTAATSNEFTVTQVAASLEMQTQPNGAASGEAFTTQPVVRILDNAGLVVTTGAAASLAVTAEVESGTGTLSGTQTVNAVNGIATFTDLAITGSGAHTLEFTTATPALAIVSAGFAVSPAAPVATQLAITTPPDGAVSGIAFTTQPVIEVRDAEGELVTTATNAVTVEIATGTGALFGTATVNAVAGVATFTDLRINGSGAHTLTITATGLTAATTSEFTVTQNAASLVVQTQPDGAVSGDAFLTQPVVRILDNAGLVVAEGAASTLAVTAAVESGTGALSGTVTVNAVNGIATFTNLVITGDGAHTLEFSTDTPALAVVSASFDVLPGAVVANELIITTQPGGAVSGVALTSQPTLEVRDADGNIVTTANDAVTVAIGTGTGTLLGTQTVNAVNGLVTFTDLRIDGSGAHTLAFSAPALTSATSSEFTVTQVAASLEIQTQPSGAASGAALTTQPIVRILDNAGLLIDTGAASALAITATVESGSGTIGGTQTVNAVNGIGTFTDLAITGSGAHRLRFATDTPELAIVSAVFAVTPAAPATQLGIVEEPDDAVSGLPFSQAPVVEVRDAAGDLVTAASNAVSVTSTGPGALVGTTTVNAVDGVATFNNLRVNGGGDHTLTFSAAGLTSAISDEFEVRQVAASLSISTQPSGAERGVAFTPQPVIHILDHAGLLVVSGEDSELEVTARRASGSANLLGMRVRDADDGVVRYTNLRFVGGSPGPHTIEFSTDSPALSVVSATINLTADDEDSFAAEWAVGQFTRETPRAFPAAAIRRTASRQREER